MKVTGGTLRSRRLRARGAHIRPTPGRVKEALFSILAPRIEGARFLDLFAGSGAIGFEALSRGAATVLAVESDRQAAEEIRETANTLEVTTQHEVVAAPYERALYRISGPFDLVFADPPYADQIPFPMFRLLQERGLLAPDAIVIFEHSARTILPDVPGYRLERQEVYGDVALGFFRSEQSAA